MDLEFYKNKSVFVTGHTGFKGAWLCQVLKRAGARVFGYALEPVTGCIYETASIAGNMTSATGDIRDPDKLSMVFHCAQPEIVFHLAAQPLVLDAFERPAYTFDVNVQGTVNLLECIRRSDSVKSVVIVTTDKVYRNNEWEYGYRENDALGDTEPYAASKACAEIATASYSETFLKNMAVSTVRAGNVIGGGDISVNRIVPDCIRAAVKNEEIIVRNPYSVRPYQHVLEPLFAYLHIAQMQYDNLILAGCYNIGPNESDCVTTAELVSVFCSGWGNMKWIDKSSANAPHESGLLKLDCSKVRSVFGWKPIWNIQTAIQKTIEWERAENKAEITDRQIEEYYGQAANS